MLPQPIIRGDRYSKGFEDCWRQILADSGDSYLEATEQSIAERTNTSLGISRLRPL